MFQIQYIHGILFVLFQFITVSNALSISSTTGANETNRTFSPGLLVISYDAFRPEYFNRSVTPYMNELRKNGSTSDYLKNEFPTKTFVNHHSIATGMYPSVHGVLANSVYDLKLQKKLDYGYELFHYNENIIPIWTLNEKAGKHSGCMMWPGSNLPYSNITCTFSQPYNTTMPWIDRVDKAISWFTDPKTPVNLVMMYFEEPDKHAHAYSPDSEVITSIVKKLDDLTKYIHEKLITENLIDRINVIHVSDHGMSSVSSPNFIDFTKWLDNGTYEVYGSSPVLQVVPIAGKELDIFTRLQKAATENGHFNVYNKDNIPKRWYCQNHQRMGPITVVANVNYAFQDMFSAAEYYQKEYNVTISPLQKYGVHGYDNDEELMHAMFFANGPAFKEHTILPPFSSVDLYDLFCAILGIQTVPNNGTIANVAQMLIGSSEQLIVPASMGWSSGKMAAVSIPLALLLIACVIGGLFYWKRYRNRHRSRTFNMASSEDTVATTMEGEKLLQTNRTNFDYLDEYT